MSERDAVTPMDTPMSRHPTDARLHSAARKD